MIAYTLPIYIYIAVWTCTSPQKYVFGMERTANFLLWTKIICNVYAMDWRTYWTTENRRTLQLDHWFIAMIYHQCANNNRLAWVQHCLNLYDFAFYYFRRSMNKYIELFYEEINISLTDACSNVNCVMVGCLKYGIWMNVDVEVSETTRKFNAAESCT